MANTSLLRTRWAAIGAAVAVTLGTGSLAVVDATVTSGERTVFVAITPCRLVDTRPASTVGPKSSPVGPAETHTVAAHGTTGDCTIPADAVALSLNVTALGATAGTFLAVWPAGAPRPDASSLNPSPGQPPTPNAVTTDLSTDGRFSIFNLQGSVDVLIDVNGYYADHNHDDRYSPLGHSHEAASTTETVQISHRALQFAGVLQFINNCPSPSSGGQFGYIPVQLPVGSTLRRARVAMLDAAGSTNYGIGLRRTTVSGNGLVFTTLASATGSTIIVNQVVQRTLTPSTTEVVEPGEAFEIFIDFGSSNSPHALCQVSVDYDRAP